MYLNDYSHENVRLCLRFGQLTADMFLVGFQKVRSLLFSHAQSS